MKNSTRIIPATLRDLSYIAANLRPEDRAEIDCQLDQRITNIVEFRTWLVSPKSPSSRYRAAIFQMRRTMVR